MYILIMNEVEHLMFRAVRCYYDRDFESLRKIVAYLATFPNWERVRRLIWWKRFMIDVSAWEKQHAD